MGTYRVRWEIDVEDEPTPEAAARSALDAILRPGSLAHVFDVYDGLTRRHGSTWTPSTTPQPEGWSRSAPRSITDPSQIRCAPRLPGWGARCRPAPAEMSVPAKKMNQR